jgi:hypothetical protein
LLGYGAPDFLNLHQSDRMVTVKAVNSQGVQPADILFFHDSIAMDPATTPSTNQQGVEIADEGNIIFIDY